MKQNRDFLVEFGLFGGCATERGARKVRRHQVYLFSVVMVNNCRIEGQK